MPASSSPPQGTTAPQPKIVACPQCGGDSIYAPSNPWRPFCSERCKKMDLGAWASESYRMPEPPRPEGAPFEDNAPSH